MRNINSELENLQAINLDAGQVFSGKSSGTIVKGYANPTTFTPTVEDDYIFPEASKDIIVWLLSQTEPLYLFGPSGCGKTSCIKQLAARLNYPVFEVTGHGRLEFADFAGHLSVKKGSMYFEYGPLALAMRYGGLFLFNEIDLTALDIAAGLHGVLDGSPLCLAENAGELVKPHPLFKFAATANTNAAGDESGLYQGTQRQNLAFADRFIFCEMGYPKAEIEEKLLADRFSILPEKIRVMMVKYANEVRALFMGTKEMANLSQNIEVTFSTRSLLRWVNLTVKFQALSKQGISPINYALDRAIGFRASRETRAMLHELLQRMLPKIQED